MSIAICDGQGTVTMERTTVVESANNTANNIIAIVDHDEVNLALETQFNAQQC